MADEIITVAEPVVAEPTVTPVQTETPQEPKTTLEPKVEGSVEKPQAHAERNNSSAERPYDGMFRSERKRIRRLEETNNQLSEKIEKLVTLLEDKKKTSEPLDHNMILTDPDKYLTAREQKLREEIQALRNDVLTERQAQVKVETERKGLEAIEKLFPKTSPDSKETLEERVQKNPERAEALKEFFDAPKIKAITNIDPESSVELALAKFGVPETKPDPLVLKKSTMGGTATGNPSGGNKGNSEEDLLAEKRKLDAQLEANPKLRWDEGFKKKKAELMKNLERLVVKGK